MFFIPRLIPASITVPIGRGLALFFAFFTLLNLAGALRSPGFNANHWWIDVGYLPTFASHTVLLIASLGLLAFGIGYPNLYIVRRAIGVLSFALAAAVFWNVIVFYGMWLLGRIHPGMWVPLSLVLSMVFSFIVRATFLPWKVAGTGPRLLLGMTFLTSFVLFPLAQMYCFGETDYRRKADAIVVFGALVNADGTPSQALADRVRTGVDLYKQHLAGVLIFSGGPGKGKASEPEAMRTLARSLGVADSAIILDEDGLNTDKTVANTVAIFRERHFTRVLAVSHFYHLPRVKMAYGRALFADQPPIEVLTVPAEESSPLVALPKFMAREVVALWDYYLRPLWRAA
jgi:uncharacterized SAM-binding protein YcdF (DUF218 family)